MKAIKKTKSLCPSCYAILDAEIFERDGQVFIRKTCPTHGEFEDIYWSDAEQYYRMASFGEIGSGLENPRTKIVKGCPFDCGICPEHKSYSVLTIIDVTNQCNLRCPICFAHAGASGYVYEPSKEIIFKIIDNLRSNLPIAPVALQFSGGEPTLRDDLPELVEYALKSGFPHVEVNSNGIRLANDFNYLMKLKNAGLSTVYLQFDGVTPEPYVKTRGTNLLPTKLKALENFRKAEHLSVVLVPTLVNGVNDNQVGDIIFFAAKNFDIVRAVNFQPVSVTGRIHRDDLKRMRITISDFMKLAEQQTAGRIRPSDFYPMPFVIPFARAVGAINGVHYTEFTAHPHCGVATFVIVKDDEIVPITRIANVEKFMEDLKKVYREDSRSSQTLAKINMVRSLRSMGSSSLKGLLKAVMATGDYEDLARFMHNVIMIGGMHFMDAYNFDLDRVQRCCIHYGVPDGRIIPFCTMNNLYRESIERAYSIPLSAWKGSHVESISPSPRMPKRGDS